ncbi:MAG: tRNA (adenosine(37)-N6)-threonylcarbamoyltransferase complex ATPase subunit type 1 TsaE [Planctomycetota bacterium]
MHLSTPKVSPDLDVEAMRGYIKNLCRQWPQRLTIGLVGTLGAGKTTTVQAIAEALGIDHTDVTSPTFTLLQTYDIDPESAIAAADFEGFSPPPVMNHLDAYRLADEDEFVELGVDELFAAPGWTLVEWADRVEGALPKEMLWMGFTITPDDRRKITLAACLSELSTD